MNSTRASMHGPGIDTFMGPHGNMTEDYDDEDDRGSQKDQTDDEEEEESVEQKTVETAQSTLIQSAMDQSLPSAQPRLSDISVAMVKLKEEQ